MAAVLACGEGAVLSHESAASLWQIVPPLLVPVHVTIASDAGRRQRPGIRLHRSLSLPGDARTRRNGIPVTTAARTLMDLRRSAEPRIYRQALREAAYLNLDLGGIEHDGTRSEPEREFLRLCRRLRVPLPEVNVRIGRFTVDFLWRTERLVVEVDAWSSHRGTQAFEDDHARDLELRAEGYRVQRYTAGQVRGSPEAVARNVLAGLHGG